MDYALFVVILLILLFSYCIYCYIDAKNMEDIRKKMYPIYLQNRSKHKRTPKILMQTYHDKSVIAPKVYRKIKKFAPNYKHLVYDDDDCIRFLDKHYGKR